MQEGLTQLEDRNNYVPLETPMVKDTFQRMQNMINDLHLGGHIDDMTKDGLLRHLINLAYQCFTDLQRFTRKIRSVGR